MFDSSWNSNAYQRFCAEVAILQAGVGAHFVLFNTLTGEPVNEDVFATREEAEQARRDYYDGFFSE